jgi:hypothetical protein
VEVFSFLDKLFEIPRHGVNHSLKIFPPAQSQRRAPVGPKANHAPSTYLFAFLSNNFRPKPPISPPAVLYPKVV